MPIRSYGTLLYIKRGKNTMHSRIQSFFNNNSKNKLKNGRQNYIGDNVC